LLIIEISKNAMHYISSCRIFFTCLLGCLTLSCFSQNVDRTKSKKPVDSLEKPFVERMQEFAKQSAKESAEDFESDKAVLVQARIFEDVRLTMQSAKGYMNAGLDTLALKTKLKGIQADYKLAADGVFINKGTAQTYRNLTATKKILNELIAEARVRKTVLDTRLKALNGFRYRLDSLTTAPELFHFPKDSLELVDYLKNLVTVAYEITPVDTALKVAGRNIQQLLNGYNMEINRLQINVEEIEHDEQRMAETTLRREFPNIAGTPGFYRPFSEILNFSRIKGVLTLKFYAIDNSWKLLALVVLSIISYIYLRSLKIMYQAKQLLNKGYDGQLVIRYPIFSAILLVVTIFQFIFISPPFILNVIFWLISCVCLTIIFRGYITRYWMIVWLLMVSLFIFASADNMVLQASRVERWYMLGVALLGVISGLVILIQRRQNELKENWIGYAIGFMVFLESCSLLMNIFGRYNLAKTLFIGGFLNVVIAILFLWVVRLINEGLVLAFDVYTVQDKKLFYLNSNRVGKRAPLLFYVLLILGWFILMGHNFPLFEYLFKPFLAFLGKDRTIGNYSFSINGLFLFFAIMTISVLISKIVSFFASDEHLAVNIDQENKGLGSWLLLVRIFILSSGLFLAIAAAGIPMDRITIIIGALGVGIGFGLQTLVNNLVSGLIIAFEKPVNVGDIVDVDGHGGTMKSIGFRSSVISTWDGADLVMPNGDLLNSHLMNWTLAGNRKRVSIVIGVAYNTDLEKCRQLIKDILIAEERISKKNPPVVQFEEFGESSINLRIYFWSRHMSDNNSTRNDLIISILQAFKEHKIEIPFPQQDVRVNIIKEE
jgi:potassium efflux system protein